MKIKNKQLFYTGLAFQIVPLVAALLFMVSFIDWNWLVGLFEVTEGWLAIIFSTDNLKYYLIGLFLILYEVASFLLIWGGLKK